MLSHREHEILHQVVHRFVRTASPVASKTLAEEHGFAMSPATIRNTLHQLEQRGFLEHPHTSAGRIPTESGYRYFVDSLLTIPELSESEQTALDAVSRQIAANPDEAVQEGARLLARLSHTLAVILAPKLADAVFRSVELVPLSSSHALVVLSVDAGWPRTIQMEVRSDLKREDFDRVGAILNERLSGRKLTHIAGNLRDMLNEDIALDRTGLIRILVDRADVLFDDNRLRRFHFGGIEYLALHPEFSDLSRYRGIIDLAENRDLMVHLLDDTTTEGLLVRIGREHKVPELDECAMVSMPYQIGSIRGRIGLIGPKRMNYPRMMALVHQLATRFQLQP